MKGNVVELNQVLDVVSCCPKIKTKININCKKCKKDYKLHMIGNIFSAKKPEICANFSNSDWNHGIRRHFYVILAIIWLAILVGYEFLGIRTDGVG